MFGAEAQISLPVRTRYCVACLLWMPPAYAERTATVRMRAIGGVEMGWLRTRARQHHPIPAVLAPLRRLVPDRGYPALPTSGNVLRPAIHHLGRVAVGAGRQVQGPDQRLAIHVGSNGVATRR